MTVLIRAFSQRRRSMERIDIGSLKVRGKSRQRLIGLADIDVCWMQERKRDAKLQIDCCACLRPDEQAVWIILYQRWHSSVRVGKDATRVG